ncbi:uncharacterized protein IL334_005441 [Kwoniella shivajii]|uniref:Glycosyltransferase family 28 N-terminal domain-containing protein n=1 Tax=Kwoniella shivajii TaxID=564305 RepID=A0ABZ1D512_9TREE|nr:hypothetical protein IL334_005441 [Kwoniella shivajii]
MAAMTKKITSIFSSPSSSPRLNATKSNTAVPPLTSEKSSQVSRTGMPCSSQLFDMFKFMAGGNTDSGLAGDEVDSDEDESNSSDASRTSTAVDHEEHINGPITEDREGLQRWMDQNIKQTERERDSLSAKLTESSPELGSFVEPDGPTDTSAAMGIPEMTDEQKLAAIKDEFGTIEDLMLQDEPERLLADTKGLLFNDAEQRGLDVVHAGVVTVHRSLGARRVWMELTPEMVTTYASANESDRVRPLRSVLCLETSLEHTGQVEDCPSSRLQEPKSQVHKVKTPTSETKRTFSFPRSASPKPERRSSSPNNQKLDCTTSSSFGFVDNHAHREKHLDFNIAVLNEQVWFTRALEVAVKAAADRKYKPDIDIPPIIFQIAGHDCVATDEEIEKRTDLSRTSSTESEDSIIDDDDDHDTFLHETRKAERASMAAKVFGLQEHEGVWTPDIKVMTRISSLVTVDSASVSSDQKPVAPQFDPTSTIPRAESPGVIVERHPADILAPTKDHMYHTKVVPDEAIAYMPFVANKPVAYNVKLTPRTFVCLTIGSRGDVQPYIALGLRLIQDGHKVVIVTHRAQVLLDAWNGCHDADVLIESPSTMAGIHIAEGLKIPYFRAFTMPWTRTSAYPHAFMVPAFEMGPSFNYSTYVLFDNIIWKATAGQINRWRKKHLGLKSTDMSTLSVSKVPFLYNFSSAVVPKPLDWHDDITITGYWNLEDSDTDWSPPADLEDFMAKAKEDGKALVYIPMYERSSQKGGRPEEETQGKRVKKSNSLPVALEWTRYLTVGCSRKVSSLRSEEVANALIKATTDTVMIEKAAMIGQKIRSENGVDQALQAIQHNVIRAGLDRRQLKWAS